MKTNLFKYSLIVASAGILVACSTKKDKWANRNFQALNTKYNVMYHGNVALDKGIEDLKTQYKDNFWEILPIERMTTSIENRMPGDQAKNANFERAEDKAIKAIQKRSMNIGGKERNPQMDEAHLLLGKSRYYEQRFVPALEAFNYVLYKYPESDKIYEVKIWREKTNMRLENNTIAITNLRKLLKEIKFKDQIFADANAAMAQAFLNEELKDSAIVVLRKAHQFTQQKEEKARYKFILGQLFEQTNQPDSAFAAYQSVIDMKRNAPKQYVIQAIGKQTLQFNSKNGDTIAFNEKYEKLFKDRENRPYLANLNHQLALHYDKENDKNRAIKFYNASLKQNTEDQYLKATNYKNLAIINFDKAQYLNAGKYYDSTMIYLDPNIREFKNIKKKRENLDDVIKYEAIANRNDSILAVVAMSDESRIQYFQKHIDKIKAEDLKAEALEKKKQDLAARNSGGLEGNGSVSNAASKNGAGIQEFNSGAKPSTTSSSSAFYFYNPTTVAYGKNEFRKKWGSRSHKEDWRWISSKSSIKNEENQNLNNEQNLLAGVESSEEKIENPRYKTDFYLAQIPTQNTAIDSLKTERNFAYYQLGIIYKEKFNEYELAAQKLETLLKNNPEERLILPSYYNLFKIYEIINPAKATAMKSKIITEFPTSRYAQILQSNNGENLTNTSPEKAYATVFNEFEKGDILKAYQEVVKSVDEFTGDEIAPKFELLKAHITGKLKGVAEYKTALNYVALTFPNTVEGKEAENLIKTNIPKLEKINFDLEKPKSWKIIYPVQSLTDASSQVLLTKLTNFAKERTVQKLSVSTDVYTLSSYFVVLHGIPTEEIANDILTILKDYKDYKIANPASIISTENYKVVQVKKNYDTYLLPRTIPTEYPTIVEENPVMDPKKEEPKNTSKRRESKANNNNVPVVPKPPGPDSDEEQPKPDNKLERRRR